MRRLPIRERLKKIEVKLEIQPTFCDCGAYSFEFRAREGSPGKICEVHYLDICKECKRKLDISQIERKAVLTLPKDK